MLSEEWQGGKPAGCVSIQNTLCQVVFSKLSSKCFSYSMYGGQENAIVEAEKYRRRISDENGLTKNMYRRVEDYLEVKLQRDLVLLCELEHLPIVEERIWTANKSKKKYTYYVKSRESVRRGQDAILFHNRVYPELEEVDHINRDGLDNRRRNIREGKGRINASNKRIQKNNTSGVKGVYKSRGIWYADWMDIYGKRKTKSFPISKFGEEAFKMACEKREREHYIVMLHLDGYYLDGNVCRPYHPAKIVIEGEETDD